MKQLLASILLLVLCAPSFAKEYKCSQHKHLLLLKEGGFEHAVHHLLLNGEVLIKELEQANWFIETVRCTSTGFEIVASHIQYNDSTKQTFVLTVINPRQYQIKEGI